MYRDANIYLIDYRNYFKDNFCPSHADGYLKGTHKTAYKQD